MTRTRTFHNPKHGDITTTLSDEEAVEVLKKQQDQFSQSLVTQFPKLSMAQHYWLHKKALEASSPNRPKGIDLGDFQRIHTMFHAAAQHLKRPKITLMDDEGHILILSIAPAEGKNPGCIYVKDVSKVYLGKITAEGSFFPNSRCPATVTPYLRSFAQNPEEIAAKYGKLTGNCCFCQHGLTDKRSTEVGYGPICADRYNLAWGSRKA